MPLPRFQRLDPAAQAAFLAIARAHFARDGRDGASLNRIIADAGLSKTSAYNYFDGKDDLYEAVVAGSLARLAAVLGDWPPASDAAGLWAAFHAANARLAAFLAANPDERALLAGAAAKGEASPWLAAFFDNAVALGLVDLAPGRELMARATAAVLGAFDDWSLSQPPAEPDAARLEQLLRRLWAPSPAPPAPPSP